jgi:hypothetical protein
MKTTDDTEIEINSALLRNRNILRENYQADNINIPRLELIEQGFVFSYFTHRVKHQNHVFDFSYDFGIEKSEGDCFEIKKLIDLSLMEESMPLLPKELLVK